MLIKEYRIPLPVTVEEYRIAQLYMIAVMIDRCTGLDSRISKVDSHIMLFTKKKSREETKGAGSGVEILVNEPYEDGPGGKGQYTRKIYHVGSHLPGWFKSLLPKSALTVEEEAWNAYPYTKTRFTCPFVQRFSLEIETYYFGDAGHQENVFNLSGSDLRNRVVDLIDIVKDQLHGADYIRDEDPRVYTSLKTGRGPLIESWKDDFWAECKDKEMPLSNGKAVMCAYKLCRVEFHYWGMQSKIEKFIHDIALRKMMLRAHRQAWAWQDEWHGLTMEDIRQIEKDTAEALKMKMAGHEEEDRERDRERNREDEEDEEEEEGEETGARESSTGSSGGGGEGESSNVLPTPSGHALHGHGRVQTHLGDRSDRSDRSHAHLTRTGTGAGGSSEKATVDSSKLIHVQISDMSEGVGVSEATTLDVNVASSCGASKAIPIIETAHQNKGPQWSRTSSKTTLNSPGSNSSKSFELLASWRMESLVRRDSDSGGSEDEFFDCLGKPENGDDASSLTKWSSLDLIPQETDTTPSLETKKEDSIFCQPFIQRMTAQREKENSARGLVSRGSMETSLPGSPTIFGGGSSGGSGSCSTTVLCLVIHAGSALDATMDLPAKKSDVTTFRGAFESVIRQHYPSMMGHVAIKLVPCPSICTDALGILSSLSPYSFDVYGTGDSPQMTHESVPIGAIPLMSASQHEYFDAVGKTVAAANQVYQEFLRSEEGLGFGGQIIIIGDSMGSVLAYDALTRHSHSGQYAAEDDAPPSPGHGLDVDHLHAGHVEASRRRSSSSASDTGSAKLDFEITDFFMFGSPLGLVLAHRKIYSEDRQMGLGRPCHQVFNLFHPTDPLATRLEPLISARFAAVSPVNVARYAKYPLGDGQPYHLLECVQCNPHIFADAGGANLGAFTPNARRLSDISITSGMSGLIDALPLQAINALTQKWWGNKRMDYALYCPEALANFPTNSLPHLFHASYWESTDAIAFILRQIGLQDSSSVLNHEEKEVRIFTPNQPREKWMKKRTSVKLKNVAANHRANDVIVKEGSPQVLKARFMYGPLDMVTLTGEKVDIYIMRDPPAGEWTQVASEVTDKNGRVCYNIPGDKSLGYGIYPVKMIVRGDHTCADFYCAVVPPKTECIVFSIDGSFTASMSVTGRDPRVRAGAVDVVRHWQELGYLIIYVTGRPDMQQHKVVSWLAQHNFPHGLVSFADGLSTDFLGHKADYLKSLVQEHRLIIHSAYGSSKDITVYTTVGVAPERIFIIGKVAKKQQAFATVLNEGYSAHLNLLMAHGGSRPAHGNARMVIPRGYFGLPGQPMSLRRRRSAKRTASYPVMGQGGDAGTTLTPGGRGVSPRRPKPILSMK